MIGAHLEEFGRALRDIVKALGPSGETLLVITGLMCLGVLAAAFCGVA